MTIVAEKPVVALDHLSWSGLSLFRQCGRRFRYRYVDKLPEERTASALLFGGAIHRAIERVHEARLAGAEIPSADALRSEYQATWKEQAAQKPEITFAKGEDVAVLSDLALRMLAAYREHVVQSASKTEVLSIEQSARFRFIKDSDVPPIEARLDLVERQGDEIVVTDFKTARNSWNDQKVQENLAQVILYAHSVMPMLREFNARRVVTKFVVLTKGKTPKIQELTPRPEQADVDRLKEAVADVWAGIKAGVFPRNESWACKGCPFRNACMGDCGE